MKPRATAKIKTMKSNTPPFVVPHNDQAHIARSGAILRPASDPHKHRGRVQPTANHPSPEPTSTFFSARLLAFSRRISSEGSCLRALKDRVCELQGDLYAVRSGPFAPLVLLLRAAGRGGGPRRVHAAVAAATRGEVGSCRLTSAVNEWRTDGLRCDRQEAILEICPAAGVHDR
jgi:hypothetical protein